MSFRDNLIHLRASRNMTQEQLAMLLGVSRQSVTKWESEKSYPEMDKLLNMCQVFDCTLDDLVQGDLTGRVSDPAVAMAAGMAPVDVFGYDEHMRRFASKIANGVMAIILGVALSICLFSAGDPTTRSFLAFPENIAAALGILCVFCGVAIGLSLIIPARLNHSHFVRSHPYIEDFYNEEDKAQARSTFAMELIGGICAIFLGVCIVIFFDGTAYEDSLGVSLMLGCIAVGVRFIIHGAMTLSRTNVANYNMAAGEVMEPSEINQADIPPAQKSDLLNRQRTSKRVGAVCGCIMICATIIGLMLLFVPLAQGGDADAVNRFFWLPWPIGGLLCGIAALLIKGFSNDE